MWRHLTRVTLPVSCPLPLVVMRDGAVPSCSLDAGSRQKAAPSRLIPSGSALCALGKSDCSADPLVLSGGLPRGVVGRVAAGCGKAKTLGDLTATAYCASARLSIPLLLVLLKPVSCDWVSVSQLDMSREGE